MTESQLQLLANIRAWFYWHFDSPYLGTKKYEYKISMKRLENPICFGGLDDFNFMFYQISLQMIFVNNYFENSQMDFALAIDDVYQGELEKGDYLIHPLLMSSIANDLEHPLKEALVEIFKLEKKIYWEVSTGKYYAFRLNDCWEIVKVMKISGDIRQQETSISGLKLKFYEKNSFFLDDSEEIILSTSFLVPIAYEIQDGLLSFYPLTVREQRRFLSIQWKIFDPGSESFRFIRNPSPSQIYDSLKFLSLSPVYTPSQVSMQQEGINIPFQIKWILRSKFSNAIKSFYVNYLMASLSYIHGSTCVLCGEKFSPFHLFNYQCASLHYFINKRISGYKKILVLWCVWKCYQSIVHGKIADPLVAFKSMMRNSLQKELSRNQAMFKLASH
jgi:hypothetical protein